MRTKVLDAHGGKTYAVVFDKGDEVVAGLTSLAKREGWGGSHLPRSAPSATSRSGISIASAATT